MDFGEYLSIGQIAKQLGCSNHYMDKLIRAGKLRVERTSIGHRMALRRDVDELQARKALTRS